MTLIFNSIDWSDPVFPQIFNRIAWSDPVYLSLKMDPAQYSRIETGKTDPSFSTIEKIANAIGVELSDLFKADEVFKEVNSYDKSLLEKLYLIDKLEAKEKQAFFSIMDALLAKKKMKDTLANAIGLAT